MELYLANLDARDKREQAQKRFIDQYTELADKFAESQNIPSSPQPHTTEPNLQLPLSPISPPPAVLGPSDFDSLRTALASAQKARSALQAEIASLSVLKRDNQVQAQTIDSLNKELQASQRRLNDRTAEVKEQKKLVEDVQDEMISQNLQLNMAEDRLAKVEAENKELIKRWMDKMGEEADEMNHKSNW